ncbi:MAG: SAM-dependent methyltransferase [Polyangia bacterium]
MPPTKPTAERDAPRLLSPQLAYFQQHGEVFAYHNLFGFLLKMSADLIELLEFHRDTPRPRAQVVERFAGTFSRAQLDEFLDVLGEWSCLVADPAAERAELWSMIPVRARWVVFHQPSERELTLWRTDRQGRSYSEGAPAWAARLWARIDRKKTLRQLVDEVRDAAVDAEAFDREVQALMNAWVHADRQYLRFARTPPPRSEHQWPSYLRSMMPFAPLRPGVDPLPQSPLEPLATPVAPPHRYYESEVADAERQFRETETTLSHLLRVPHPLLGGATYAQRLTDALITEGLLREPGADEALSILEIGAGLGHLAEGVLSRLRERHPKRFAAVRYTILDLSPALRAAQARRLAEASLLDKVTWLGANAEHLELPEASFDLVLSNEVIGDLTNVKLSRELLGLDDEHSPAESYAEWSAETTERLGATGRVLRAYSIDLSDSPAEFFFNVGSVELLERIARALRPGGGAFLSEYGERSRYPIAGTHLDHLEFSIHFAPLMQVAERLGLEASLQSVQELIGLDRSALTLATTRTYFSSLRAMLAAAGRELDKIAYTREMFLELVRGALDLDRIGDVRFHPVDERCMGLAPHEFKALIVLKR